MKRAHKFAAAIAGSIAAMTAVATTASANYTGYADGAPGPADIWAASHPSFGKVTHSWLPAHRTHRHHHHMS